MHTVRTLLAWGLLALTCLALLAACGDDGAAGAAAGGANGLSGGEAQFTMHCSVCHGEEGTGTTQGPPLVHIVYEPSHHPDDSFRRAVREGVLPHHWGFGPMPAIPALSDEQVERIIVYVRDLQREAGIS